MKLIDLKPRFLRHEFRFTDGVNQNFHRRVKTIQEAQGIEFLCPLCLPKNAGAKWTHRVICWSRSAGAPDHVSLTPGRWRIEGTGFHDLTLAPEPDNARAILVHGCYWYGYVTNGDVHGREALHSLESQTA